MILNRSFEKVKFFDAKATTGWSDAYAVGMAGNMNVQIDSTGTSYSVSAYGSIDGTNYHQIGVIKMADYSFVSEGIEADGIYNIPLAGYDFIKLKIDSITSASVTAIAKVTE